MSSINEERQRLGLDPVPWGNTPLVPINIMPLGSAAPTGEGKQTKAMIPEVASERKKRVHIIQSAKLENDYTKRLEKLFVNWIDRIVKNMERFGKSVKKDMEYEDFFLLSLGEMQDELWTMSRTEILRAIEQGWMTQMAEAGVDIDFHPDYTRVVKHLQDRQVEFKTVAERFHGDVKGVLRQGIEDGRSVPEMSKDIKKWVEDKKTWKAERIARTEMGSARNGGEYTYVENSQLYKEKTWLHAITVGEPRPAHQALDGTTIPINEKFIVNGWEMDYPQDMSHGAPAEEIINCHCTFICE